MFVINEKYEWQQKCVFIKDNETFILKCQHGQDVEKQLFYVW